MIAFEGALKCYKDKVQGDVVLRLSAREKKKFEHLYYIEDRS